MFLLALLACHHVGAGDDTAAGTPLECGPLGGPGSYGGDATVGPTATVGGKTELPDGHWVEMEAIGYVDPGYANDTGWVSMSPSYTYDGTTTYYLADVSSDSFPGGADGATTTCRAWLH